MAFVENLPGKTNTRIVQGGTSLSGRMRRNLMEKISRLPLCCTTAGLIWLPDREEPMEKREVSDVKIPMKAIAILLAFLLAAGTAGSAAAETRLMVVSDLHYLDPSLYQGSGLFLQALRQGDGKITQYGEELLAALYQEILREKPDALVVTGDLTFNGEKASHLALAGWFGTVEGAGVPVWILPGNHDINTVSPVGFTGNAYYRTENVTPEEFASIYAGFMAPEGAGFSYTAKISDRLWVAMTDVAWYQDQAQTFGLFSEDHAFWLEDALKSAREAGAQVITASHHSLLLHTEFSRENFLMLSGEKMAALARQYGVRLHLSGHLHIQHIAREDGLADAALGAFCIWPHRYAVVTLRDDGGLVYDSKSLSKQFLPEGFWETSREWFCGITREKAAASLDAADGNAGLMADYAARFNLAYFSGAYRREDPSWTEDPAYALWEAHPESAFWAYMKLVMNEPTGDNLHWEYIP